MKRFFVPLVVLLLLIAVPAPIFTAPVVNPDRPMRKPTTGAGDLGGSSDPTCTIRYYYVCSQTGSCVENTAASACCNDCRTADGHHAPCQTCVAN